MLNVMNNMLRLLITLGWDTFPIQSFLDMHYMLTTTVGQLIIHIFHNKTSM